jgi:hypothetical protein
VTPLRALLDLDIGEMFVRKDELGSDYELASGEKSVRLYLPETPTVEHPNEGSFSGVSFGAIDGQPELLGVRSVRMAVDFDADLRASEFPPDQPQAWPRTRHKNVIAEVEEAALDAYRRLRAWARVGGAQHRGAPRERPDVKGIELIDLEAKTPIILAVGSGQAVVIRALGDAEREALPSLEVLAAHVRSREEPPLAEALLADARALPTRPGAWDPLRDLLLCAIACEVKVKSRLTELVAPENAVLLGVILDNPREVSQSVTQLLGKTCLAIAGTSLADNDPKLFSAVQLLFKQRNDVAHRAKLPTDETNAQPLETASSLFAWLDTLGT